MENNGYSLADIASVANNEGWGGGNAFVLIILFAMIFGGGFGWNNRGGDYGQYATAASQQEILFGQHFQNLDNKIDRLGNGLADVAFSLNNSVKDGNYAVSSAVITEGRATQSQIQQNRFDMANYAAQFNQHLDNKFAELEKNQLKSQIESLSRENNQLFINQQLCGVVRYPNSWSYNAGTSPFCNCNQGCCR